LDFKELHTISSGESENPFPAQTTERRKKNPLGLIPVNLARKTGIQPERMQDSVDIKLY